MIYQRLAKVFLIRSIAINSASPRRRPGPTLGKRRADDAPLFKVSSQNALLDTLKGNGGNALTVHAFCSSFSDWVIGATSYGADLADMCIAHLTRGKVRAAYQRSPQLEKRREMMAAWSDFVTTPGVTQSGSATG